MTVALSIAAGARDGHAASAVREQMQVKSGSQITFPFPPFYSVRGSTVWILTPSMNQLELPSGLFNTSDHFSLPDLTRFL